MEPTLRIETPVPFEEIEDSGVRAVQPSWPPRSEQARYEVGSVLGRGGMGEVRTCEDRRVRRTVAMKRLIRGTDEPAVVGRFLDEARLQARLEHPAIVPVYDVGAAEDGTPFFTMKRVRGVTLAEVLQARRRGKATLYSTRRLLNAYVTVCLAMEYAHRCGVVHGDLKPENVMLGRFGEVHVLDWGCAARASGAEADGGAGEGGSVLRGLLDAAPSPPRGLQILGTPGYLSPEQARGLTGDCRSDVYSLGAILFELLTGERLHEGATPLARVVATMERPAQRPSERAPERAIAPALDALVEAALSADPAERPTAQQLAVRIEAHLDDELERTSTLRAAEIQARLAGQHARSAERSGSERDRGEALRSAGRALSLDPGNLEACAVLERLLAGGPGRLPDDAKAACTAIDEGLAHSAARAMQIRSWIWLAMIAPALAMGIRSWPGASLAIGTLALASLGFTVAARRSTLGPWARAGLLAVGTVAVAAMSCVFGPLVLTPVFATTTATLLATGLGARERRWACLAGLAAILGPLALELVGVLPPSFSLVDGAVVLLPRVVDFAPGPTAAFLVVSSLLSVPMGVLLGGRLRDAIDERLRALAAAESDLKRALPLAIGERLAAAVRSATR